MDVGSEVELAPERRFLGTVEVDSGTLILGDPAYFLPHAEGGKPGIDYESVLRAPDNPVTHLEGRPVMLLARFGGDGTYPVYGELDERGALTRVTIEFVGPDDDDDDEDDGEEEG